MTKHSKDKTSTDEFSETRIKTYSRPLPGFFVPYTDVGEQNSFSLFDLWDLICSRKLLISSVTTIFAASGLLISLWLPNMYKAEVLVAPISEENGIGLAKTLGGLGGLASLAGVQSNDSNSLELHLAVLMSREFLWKYILDKDLMPILFSSEWDKVKRQWIENDKQKQPTLWDAYRLLVEKDVLTTSTNKNSGLVTVAIEWTDPTMSAEWANELVNRLNDHLRNQAINRGKNNLTYLYKELASVEIEELRLTLFELITKEQNRVMLANTQKDFAFRVIDPAVIPDKKSKPSRVLIAVGSIFLGLVLSFFAILGIVIKKKLIKMSCSE